MSTQAPEAYEGMITLSAPLKSLGDRYTDCSFTFQGSAPEGCVTDVPYSAALIQPASFGEFIKRQRPVSQRALGHRLGIRSNSTIHQLEVGMSQASLARANRIYQSLGGHSLYLALYRPERLQGGRLPVQLVADTDDASRIIGGLFGELRRSSFPTQSDMAAHLGIGQGNISTFEAGQSTLRVSRAAKYFATLGVSVAFCGIESPCNAQYVPPVEARAAVRSYASRRLAAQLLRDEYEVLDYDAQPCEDVDETDETLYAEPSWRSLG